MLIFRTFGSKETLLGFVQSDTTCVQNMETKMTVRSLSTAGNIELAASKGIIYTACIY